MCTTFYCGVTVMLPAGSAAGNWRVAQIVVFDNAGRQSTFKNPAAQSVTATSNATLTASNFTLSPNPVNNWRGDVMGALTLSVAGAKKGVSAVYVDFDGNSSPAARRHRRLADRRLVHRIRRPHDRHRSAVRADRPTVTQTPPDLATVRVHAEAYRAGADQLLVQ
ncbi:hypothetical protein ACFPIJ_27630 [Dactylosporangium cerinum]|uniref:Uncharacterized protein n=1 Tax=Dactylosporangium cerinum TaxID=1434730 RepID=A0ABV9VZQ1_9ACTN